MRCRSGYGVIGEVQKWMCGDWGGAGVDVE